MISQCVPIRHMHEPLRVRPAQHVRRQPVCATSKCRPLWTTQRETNRMHEPAPPTQSESTQREHERPSVR
jgi:hypothetical protein